MDCIQGTSSISGTGIKNNDKPITEKEMEKSLDKERQPGEVLPVTKLRFSGEQLEVLNYHLGKKICHKDEDEGRDFCLSQPASIVERLTQRLLCAVGNLDPRFASKFLISLQDNVSNGEKCTLEYVVRLDTLSTPVLYPKDPVPTYEILEFDSEGVSPGFARIRLRNKTSTNWAEFINSSGFLRRDKIQERFVELLALAAAGTWPVSPLDVDDSTLCAAPGKILDAATLHHVLHTPPDEQVFYGPASNCLRFPDPRDFRLAIVDEPAGIRLRVGFLAPGFAGYDVDVRLLVALGVDAWPRTTDLPHRVQMGHAESLLYQEVALTGMYLVAAGQNSASWQILLPAAEVTLLQHHGPSSTVKQVLQILYELIDDIHSRVSEERCKFHCKLLPRRLLRETLFQYLESSYSSPLCVMAEWSTGQVSRHVLRLLDRLVGALRAQNLPGYFFSGENLLGNPGNAREEDYLVEANRLYMCMARLHSVQTSFPRTTSYTSLLSTNILDAALTSRWRDVVGSLLPPAATRSCRFSSISREATSSSGGAYTHYTQRQLEYVGVLVKSVLDVKQNIVQLPQIQSDFQLSLPEDPIEDIIYLLVTIIEQARDHTFNDHSPLTSSLSLSTSTSTLPTSSTKSRGKSSNRKKYRTTTKAKSQFDSATAKLVEAVRKEKRKKKGGGSLEGRGKWEDVELVRSVLRYLYKALDHSRHTLAPVLRPYLQRLFVASHEISWTWYLHQVKKKDALEEIHALGMFAKVVNKGQISPAAGLVDAVNKGWSWASQTLSLVSICPLRVIFIPSRGKVLRHILSLPSYNPKQPSSATPSTEDVLRGKKNATLPTRNSAMGAVTPRNGGTVPRGHRVSKTVPTHQELKMLSPMTQTFQQTHLQGKHRCAGDIMEALAALNKISILHELSHILAPDNRRTFLATVQRLCREYKRQSLLRRRCTIPSTINRKKIPPKQLYTPTAENFHLEKDKDTIMQMMQSRERTGEKLEKDTLIGSCRAARIKEDSRVIFHENFKIQALFKNENSA